MEEYDEEFKERYLSDIEIDEDMYETILILREIENYYEIFLKKSE